MTRQGAATRVPRAECTHPADQVRAFCAEVYDRLGATLQDIEPARLVRFDDPDKPRGNKACVPASELHMHAQRLDVAAGDIGTIFCRRLQNTK